MSDDEMLTDMVVKLQGEIRKYEFQAAVIGKNPSDTELSQFNRLYRPRYKEINKGGKMFVIRKPVA